MGGFKLESQLRLSLFLLCVQDCVSCLSLLDLPLPLQPCLNKLVCFYVRLLFFVCFLSSELSEGSKDEMLLDMMNKQQSSVSVCSSTPWMTGGN